MTPVDAEPARGKQRLSRRELLHYIWAVLVGAFALAVAGIGAKFSLPRPGRGEYGGVIDVGPVTDLPEPGSAPASFPEGRLWIVRTDDGLVALNKVCTHLDCLVGWDELEGQFVCPCHGSKFEVDGTFVSGPAPRSLDRYAMQIIASDGSLIAENDPATGELGPLAAEAGDSSPSSSGIVIPSDAIIQVDTGYVIAGASAVRVDAP